MKPLVFLVGSMGAGKTTLGKKLATRLQMPFYDLDAFIEEQRGKSIAIIFEEDGESTFRSIEQASLKAIIAKKGDVGGIVSLGGGTPCFFDNITVIKQAGVAIYLKPPVGVTVSRIEGTGDTRPLLANKTKDELTAYVLEVLEKREPFYAQAHITFDSSKYSAAQLDALCASIQEHV